MRSGPVNLVAAGTAPELLIIDFCKRLEFLNHVGFRNLPERRIAAQAARERSDDREKRKAPEHFDCLIDGIL